VCNLQSKRANLSQGGDAKPRDSLSQPGRRTAVFLFTSGLPCSQGLEA
jgi:hypothetical protein